MSRQRGHTHVTVWALCATEDTDYGWTRRSWIQQKGKGTPKLSIQSALKWLTKEEAEAYAVASGLSDIIGPREVELSR